MRHELRHHYIMMYMFIPFVWMQDLK